MFLDTMAKLWVYGLFQKGRVLAQDDVVFFIHLATRRVHVAGITPHPNEQ